MSSHREAPEISKDPVADNTDVYAFVSPDKPSTVTLIANFIPLQKPDGGPNFYEFGDDVLYEIHISNRPGAQSDVIYQFRFHTTVRNKDSFLYATGPIVHLGDDTWNRKQFYSVTRIAHGHNDVLGTHLACPPCNVGPRSTPNYASLAGQAVHSLSGGQKVFAGQRLEGFHVDLGSIFDLGTLRPFEAAHLIPSANAVGVNGTRSFNVHSIAIQVPISDLTRKHNHPTDVLSPDSVIGVYASASRQKSRMFDSRSGLTPGHGPFAQVSRLGNPLFNEVIVPMGDKDRWNAVPPSADRQFAKYVAHPELAKLLPGLYPGVFPNLAKYHKSRADLLAILLTGIPKESAPGKPIIPGFQNYTGSTQADLLRLNVAIPPAKTANDLGLLGGDLAGYPNGRRVTDDVTTIELRAIAGLTIPLVDPSFTPDTAAGGIQDGTNNNDAHFHHYFPYLGTPGGGYQTVPGTTSS